MPDSNNRTKDISVIQLLAQLVQATNRIIGLVDDIDQFATTPQAKSALNLIGSEVNNVLNILKVSLGPLYKLYELDGGMRNAKKARQHLSRDEITLDGQSDTYDESTLWAEIKNKTKVSSNQDLQ